jgi:hypothetical protein
VTVSKQDSSAELCQFGLKLCTVTVSKQDSSAELCQFGLKLCTVTVSKQDSSAELCQFELKLCTVTVSKQDSSAELCPEVSLCASTQVILTNRVLEVLTAVFLKIISCGVTLCRLVNSY